MPKVILLPVNGLVSDTPVFRTGLTIARLFESHLMALHVRQDVQRDLANLAAADMGMGAGLDATLVSMEADATAREKQALGSWNDFCATESIPAADMPGSAGVSHEFLTETGTEADWIASHGRAADLTVIGREREAGIESIDRLEAALMYTGKAVVIAPAIAPTNLQGTIAIAWKDTPQAARAVACALPFIRLAAKVLIVTVAEDAHDAGERSRLRLAHALRWHNRNIGQQLIHPEGRSAEKALLDSLSSAGCHMLVMGGYGHGRLREAVFGGFTRTILHQAPLTVLMAH